MWTAVSSSWQQDFPLSLRISLKLWAKTRPFSLDLLFWGYLITVTRIYLKQHFLFVWLILANIHEYALKSNFTFGRQNKLKPLCLKTWEDGSLPWAITWLASDWQDGSLDGQASLKTWVNIHSTQINARGLSGSAVCSALMGTEGCLEKAG